ncbi:biotin--[acetyl-CoA-carboxylase] ligase [Pseudooctadecabacter sp.]|uniref:biotin--[acetyl-CoA-carboxylase] ligase n=1 Tax=Pseudooctadecabacter sp. TaxID=1966338 RepID=UPI0035C79D28
MSTKPDWPADVGHIHHDEVTSTLDAARLRAAGTLAPTWITATRQTASRGRRGRAWVAPVGNFNGTLIVPCSDPEQGALRSFVAALALRDALEGVMGAGPKLALKWPNDVLVNSGKIAGILLESLTPHGRFEGVAVGIGVNLVAAPTSDDVEARAVPPVSVKGESGVDVTSDMFLSHLAPAFVQWDAQLATYGFAPIRTAWLSHAAKLGETITARLPNEDVTGRFETVDENGYLILTTAKGPRTIAAADVYF